MEIYALLALMLTHFIAQITPGPDVFLILRTSLAFGFQKSIYVCLGVGAGILIWVALTAFGLKGLFDTFPMVRIALMAFSVCYLLYLSAILFISARSKKETKVSAKNEKDRSFLQFFIVGFLTNLSNPKAILYFASIFSKFISPDATLKSLLLLVGVITIETIVVFALLGRIFSMKKARESFMRNQGVLDGACSGIFFIFACIIGYDLITEIWAKF